MSLRIPLVALVLLGAAQIAQPAEACTPPLPGFSGVRPLEGTRVPLNFTAFVSGYEIFPFEAMWLDFDVFIPLRTEQVGGLGLAHFEPQSDFVPEPLELTFFSANDDGPPIEPLRTHYFVQVDARDDVPPVVSPTMQLSWEYRESEPGLCEPGGYVAIIRTTVATDAWGVAAYVLNEARSPTAPERVVHTRLASLDDATDLTFVHHVGEQPGQHCYRVTAYDIAGNPAPQASLTCFEVGEPGRPDGGVLDMGTLTDAGPVDASVSDSGSGLAPGLASGGRGCGCRAATPDPAGAALVLVGLGLWGLVRRRAWADQ